MLVEPKHRARIRRCLGVSCALALLSICVSPRRAFAQTTAAETVTPQKKTGGVKTANPKKHAKAAANDSAANRTTSPRSPHPASHPPAGTHPKSNAAAAAHNSKHGTSHKRKTTARGQQKIEPERAQAIQEALIREHYMSGEAAGTWNQSSEEAMRRYQADHGWQSKTVPDSRALISLGLGPSQDHLLNPESAMTTGPAATHASLSSASQTPVSHSADPGARMNTNTTPPADPAPAPTPDHNATGPQ